MARKSSKKKAAPVQQAEYGDRLARGAGSASFGSMSHVTDEKWNAIFGEPSGPDSRKKSRGKKKV